MDKRLGNCTEPSSPAGAITIQEVHLIFFKILRKILRDNTTKEKLDAFMDEFPKIFET
jgi:hypothetical protein